MVRPEIKNPPTLLKNDQNAKFSNSEIKLIYCTVYPCLMLLLGDTHADHS